MDATNNTIVSGKDAVAEARKVAVKSAIENRIGWRTGAVGTSMGRPRTINALAIFSDAKSHLRFKSIEITQDECLELLRELEAENLVTLRPDTSPHARGVEAVEVTIVVG